MGVYKSKFGIINESNLLLYKLKYKAISLNAIVEVKISKKKQDLNYIINYFKSNDYDFTIVLDNQEQIEFSFSKKSLNTAAAFKNRILHMKFSLQDTTEE